MIKLFLKVRHWQLFAIMLGIPLVYQLYFMSQLWRLQTPQERISEGNGFPQVLNEEFIQFDFFPYIMIFFSLVLFGWLWSIAIGLQKNIPQGVTMKIRRFKIFLFIPLVYIILLMIYMGGLFPSIGTNGFVKAGWIFAIILPLHLFSMACIFYSIYFVAKTIKTVEFQRQVAFGDFVGEFFLLWFYFIGIWFIQPKVNRLYANKIKQSKTTELKESSNKR